LQPLCSGKALTAIDIAAGHIAVKHSVGKQTALLPAP
jgi:hypothetical protein